jgi:hypothetical protein
VAITQLSIVLVLPFTMVHIGLFTRDGEFLLSKVEDY